MRLPRLLPGTVLMLVLVGHLPALELSVTARQTGDRVVVECRMNGYDAGELIRRMDSGGTVRITWQFRLGNADTTVVRYGHRSYLGEGYIVYDSLSPVPDGPYPVEEVIEALATLPPTVLDALGFWEKDEVLESRLILDYSMGIPPMSVTGTLTGSRRRTGWRELPHPEAGEP